MSNSRQEDEVLGIKGIRVDGKFYPSVTRVIGRYIIPVGWIDQYYLDFGELCHKLTETAIASDYCEVNAIIAEVEALGIMHFDQYGEKWGGLFDQSVENAAKRANVAVAWIKKKRYKKIHLEHELFSTKLGYCGHVDVFIDSRASVIIDWKFSQQITMSNKIQAEAYRQLVPGSKVIFARITRDDKGKDCEVKEAVMKPDNYLYAVFMSGMNIFRFQEGRMRK